MGQRSRAERRRGSKERSRDARPRAAVPAQTHSQHGHQAPVAPSTVTDSGTGATPDPAALVVSHWFDSGSEGEPAFNAVIRVTGRRRDLPGRAQPGDTFSIIETVPGVMPGSGRVTTTSWIYNVNPGDWDVTAELLGPERARAATPDLHLPRAAWSWRSWSLRPVAPAPVQTRWALIAPLAPAPAVLPGSFTVLAIVAVAAAIASQPIFLGWLGVDPGAALLASLTGLAAGLVGAKAWYMALKGPSRASLKEGWSVDGFLVTAPLVAALLAAAQGLSVAAYLDGVVPGIFLAVAIGRIGCFLTGCCAGRPTARWGIWSSDRRVGSKRIPAQLLESAVGLGLATLSAILLLGHIAGGSGLVFLGTMATYLLARQALLRLRAEARPFSWRRASGRVVAKP